MSADRISTRVFSGSVPLIGAETVIENGRPIIIDSLTLTNVSMFDQNFLMVNSSGDVIYNIYLYKFTSFSHYGPYLADKGAIIKPSSIGTATAPIVFFSIFYRLN
mgnify:FL=1